MTGFADFAERKTREAAAARITRFRTIHDPGGAFGFDQIGNTWSREHYDGLFLVPPHENRRLPSVSLCFVQSSDGNTGAPNPDVLGGGPMDKHLIYEGLSRVAADGVMAGAATGEGASTFFSVWHPELVALRLALGLTRHPAQIVITARGSLDLERTLLFNVPDVPAYIIAAPRAFDDLAPRVSRHPSVEVIRITDDDLAGPLTYLREKRGMTRISCIGGRKTATALLDGGFVQDLCLTTTARTTGEPGTPYYVGTAKPELHLMVRKTADDPEYPIRFEQFAVSGSSSRSVPTRRR